MLDIRSWDKLQPRGERRDERARERIVTERGNKKRRAERNPSERDDTVTGSVLSALLSVDRFPLPLSTAPYSSFSSSPSPHIPSLFQTQSPRVLSLSSAGVALVTVYLPIRNNDNQPIDPVPPWDSTFPPRAHRPQCLPSLKPRPLPQRCHLGVSPTETLTDIVLPPCIAWLPNKTWMLKTIWLEVCTSSTLCIFVQDKFKRHH